MLEAVIISADTLNPRHLAPAFLSALEDVNMAEARALEAEFEDARTAEDLSLYVDALQDALQDNAPEGMYFGTSEGDGALFGFWTVEDDDAAPLADLDAEDAAVLAHWASAD